MSLKLTKILAVIVIYKIEYSVSMTYKGLMESVIGNTGLDIEILIYNNSPISKCKNESRNISGILHYFVYDNTNAGVSKAYNYGWLLAKKMEIDWIFLLDQDSELCGNILHKYIESMHSAPNVFIFCPIVYSKKKELLSPYRVLAGFPISSNFIQPRRLKSKTYHAINSGLLINTTVFDSLNGFNEKLRLDLSDHDFFQRVKAKFTYFMVVNAILYQNLSNDEGDIQKHILRFRFFISSTRELAKKSLSNFLIYGYLLIKRIFSLSIRFRTGLFCKMFFIDFFAREKRE